MHLTIGVTGHRDLVPEEVPRIRKEVRRWLESLAAEHEGLELELLTGLAAGADQLVAEVALELGIDLIAVLPFNLDEYRKDFAEPGEAERFAALLERATAIALPPVEGDSIEGIRGGGASRDRQYAQMGVFISNHCQVLLALWDGRDSDALGGTAAVVRYHLTAVMPGFVDTVDSPNLLADNENDLLYHVTCSRHRPDGEPRTAFHPLETFWVTAHFGRQSGAHMPGEYRQILDRLEVFQADLDKYRTEIESEAAGLLADAPDYPRPGGADLADALYARADWLAVLFQKRFTTMLLLNHSLAVLMGVVFIVFSEYVDRDVRAAAVYLILFLALFAAGVGLYAISKRREWHRKYLDYRALAEALRVQTYWNLGGVVDHRSVEFAYDNFLQKQDVDLSWIRHVMRSASLRRQRRAPPDERWVNWVAAHWIGAPGISGGQQAYYDTKAAARTRAYRRALVLGNALLWAGIAVAIFLGVIAGRIDDDQMLLLLILMGVLPLMAGVRDAYSHKKADKELIKQYRFMARVFGNARRLLDNSDDTAFKRQVLKAVGDAALEEHAEWLLMHRERPLEHGATVTGG